MVGGGRGGRKRGSDGEREGGGWTGRERVEGTETGKEREGERVGREIENGCRERGVGVGGETAGERGVGRERDRQTDRERQRQRQREKAAAESFFNKDAAKHATVKRTCGHGDGVWTPTPTSNGGSLIILTQSSSRFRYPTR